MAGFFVNMRHLNHRIMKNLFFVTALFISLVSCQKEKDATSGLTAKTETNVSYGSDPAQKMDIYLPAGRTSDRTPFIVMIHGGGWNGGDKSDFTAYVDTIKRRMPEYAVFNINYRLSANSTNTFPTQENDVKAAVEFIASKTSEYNISNNMVLLGASAGGHLALLQGYKYTSPIKPLAIVDFFGPADLTEMYNHPASDNVPQQLVAYVIGTTPTDNPELYQQSSPINFITSNAAPTIIFQGGNDPLVAASQSQTLYSKLQQAGVASQLVFYPNESHGWTGPTLSDSFDKLIVFLTEHVQ